MFTKIINVFAILFGITLFTLLTYIFYNQASKDLLQLQEKIKADEELREKHKLIIESNKKELEIVINKIDNINNSDVSHEETDRDREKSKIIIDSIWEIYQGDKNGK